MKNVDKLKSRFISQKNKNGNPGSKQHSQARNPSFPSTQMTHNIKNLDFSRANYKDNQGGSRVKKLLRWVGYTPSITSMLKRVQKLKENSLYFYMRKLESASLGRVIVDQKEMIMLGSNNYLGLTCHPKVKQAAISAIDKYGTGAGGVRILSGTYSVHEKLEEQVASLKGAEAAVVFSSGYATNFGLISTLAEIGHLIINDEKNHASIIDGCKVRRAHTFFYRHVDIGDLGQVLSALSGEPNNRLLVVSDGIFSMDGDIIPLPNWLATAKASGALTMIDDAHATGVLGAAGSGTAEHFGMTGAVNITVGTLSKALAGVGGFIASTKDLITYIKHTTRAFVFASALPPSIAAACSTAIEVMQNEPEHLNRLWRNRKLIYDGLRDIGFNLGFSETPIIPVIVGDEFLAYEYARRLQDAGVFVNPVAYPAVRKQEARLRVSVTASLSSEDIGKALHAFRTIAKSLGTYKRV